MFISSGGENTIGCVHHWSVQWNIWLCEKNLPDWWNTVILSWLCCKCHRHYTICWYRPNSVRGM